MEVKKFSALNWGREPGRLCGKSLRELARGCGEFTFSRCSLFWPVQERQKRPKPLTHVPNHYQRAKRSREVGVQGLVPGQRRDSLLDGLIQWRQPRADIPRCG